MNREADGKELLFLKRRSFFFKKRTCFHHRNGTWTAVFTLFDPAKVDWCDIVICKKKYTVNP